MLYEVITNQDEFNARNDSYLLRHKTASEKITELENLRRERYSKALLLNGLAMGLATTFVLVGSNVVVSLVAKMIPDKVRIPSYVVVIASFVTIVDLSMQAYVPAVYATLGIFIPLIVVNCIVLGRAEARNNFV